MTSPLIDIDFDNLTELDPGPAPTRAYQPNAQKTKTSVKVRTPARQTSSRHDELLAAALAYAKHGLFIMPLHEPLFDAAGHVTGCTCEAYKRSEKYHAWLHLRGQAKRFDPDYTCRTPGKHPRLSDWETLASKDPDQVRAWWQRWPTANIGLAVGKSGLVTFDLDSYKDVYGDDSDLFTQADKQTVTQISGKGGEHLVYHMPADRAYTNANNTLPKGIDIRGVGGMQVLAPSLHPCGNQYEWEEGYSILECDPRPLPQALQTILDAAQQNSASAQAVTFTTPTTERPDLIRWQLSKAVRELINDGHLPNTDRSAADQTVITSLVYAGATDDQILAVFQHNLIGTQGKYAESGDAYLGHSIGKARAYATAHPRPDVGAICDNLLLWGRTHDFSEYRSELKTLRENRKTGETTLVYITDSTDTKTFDAILGAMKERQQFTITIGKKRLGKLAGVSCNTAWAALARLTGWLFDVTPDPVHGAVISLTENCRLHPIDPCCLAQSGQKAPVTHRDQSTATDKITREPINEYSPRKTAEPFLSGTSRDMRDRFKLIAQTLDITTKQARLEDCETFPGLGESGIRLIDAALRDGDMTAAEFVKSTGKKLSAVRVTLRKLTQHGLFERERDGLRGPYIYTLTPNVWERVDAIAPTLRNHTIDAQRESQRIESAQQWAKTGLEHAPDSEQAQRLERRFAKLAKQRIPHLARLHPDLDAKAIERLAYEVDAYRRSPELASQIREYRTQATDDHRNEVRLIRELADSTMDVGATLDEAYTEIMKFGTFNANMVNQVLRSPVQMTNYETVASLRKQLAKAETMAVYA